jgi:hypothetical protein
VTEKKTHPIVDRKYNDRDVMAWAYFIWSYLFWSLEINYFYGFAYLKCKRTPVIT